MDLHPEHQIAPGVRGWLESPASDVIASDCLAVAGWAFVHGHQIVDVWSTGFGARRPLQCGIRRDDVAAIYANEPTALQSGFTGYVELDGGAGDRVNFDIWARLDDGRTIRLYQRGLVTRAFGTQASLRSTLGQVLRPAVLLAPRAWLNAVRALRDAWRPPPVRPIVSATGKAGLRRATRAALAQFLESGSRLVFIPAETPVVSVVVVVWNHADLTLTCLRALVEQNEIPTEIVIVDNASTDETSEMLGRLSGVTVIRNSGNLGFTMALNIGAKVARGEFLLFVNNDAALAPGSIRHLVAAARGPGTIGAVGGKLVYTDGTLQEAGSIIWSDGSCEGYGRGSDPAAPAFNFERPVDFCSAALLLTPRALFDRLGGFDERYRPAYYDDADYCVRVWTSGHSVVYQPRASATHYEFGSTSPEASMELQLGRRPIFVSTHRRWLSTQMSHEDGSVLETRIHPHGAPSVLVIDDAFPDPRMGSGFPRAAALLQALAELKYVVTLYTTNGRPTRHSPLDPQSVEVISGNPGGLRAFLASRRHHDMVIVSRPHNMQYVKAAVGADLSTLGVPCVYDAEAVYALREIRRRQVVGQPMADADCQALIDAEIGLARGCEAVLTVSESERQLFAAVPLRNSNRAGNVYVLDHAIEPHPTPKTFEERRSILFVGAFSPQSSNEDAVTHLCCDVLPALRTDCRCAAPVVVAGTDMPDHLRSIADSAVSWHSDVDDLTPFYDNARVFVAPTRFSAGISLKVIEAAARGVPIVCTPLVANQLGWESGVEVMTGEAGEESARAIAAVYEDRDLWTRLRDAALARIARDYNATRFRQALQNSLRTSPASGEGAGRSQRALLHSGAAAAGWSPPK